MKQNKRKSYASPSLGIEPLSECDIISTSGFLGGDDGIYSPTAAKQISFTPAEPYSNTSLYNT